MTVQMNKQHLAHALRNNSNLPLVHPMRSVSSDAKPSDLSEAQKMAFVAMMRLVHDPREIQWNKRKEKMVSKRIETGPQPVAEKKPKKRLLKHKIAAMRKRKQFPLPPESACDKARRFGYIPSSVKKEKLSGYAAA
ncbi:uncharacterized protein LOC129771296 [Toxorhynchites rutilus septentrionalis]|uniref:uncharacterized protein LOC129771296 n=1 Tax=Toxorhynchites rutilus septentrionalis TaxID=329112 RepID=UPI002479F14B|nr:uncharacterized protein LOC129771296 [Toxorhynchites rutilus septentrionalis]